MEKGDRTVATVTQELSMRLLWANFSKIFSRWWGQLFQPVLIEATEASVLVYTRTQAKSESCGWQLLAKFSSKELGNFFRSEEQTLSFVGKLGKRLQKKGFFWPKILFLYPDDFCAAELRALQKAFWQISPWPIRFQARSDYYSTYLQEHFQIQADNLIIAIFPESAEISFHSPKAKKVFQRLRREHLLEEAELFWQKRQLEAKILTEQSDCHCVFVFLHDATAAQLLRPLTKQLKLEAITLKDICDHSLGLPPAKSLP